MGYILGIETSCDETAAAVYNNETQKILSSEIFSQVDLHKDYGGVVPEIASRSHLEKIGFIVRKALLTGGVSIKDIEAIAVTHKPGLAGALLIGLSFAKGLAFAHNKKLIGINHLEGHIFSSFLDGDRVYGVDTVPFPHICLVASGGHTAFFLVEGFGQYVLLGQTLDDAAGEAFDKVAKLVGLGYPGGPRIEKLAGQVTFEDFLHYPRTKNLHKTLDFSFSGLKTAVLYDLVKRGAYDLKAGIISNNMTLDLQQQVCSSLLVCISDIIKAKLGFAMKLYPEVQAVTFVGGVACNRFLRDQIGEFCERRKRAFIAPSPKYCSDNAAMIAFVGGYKAQQNKFSDFLLDVYN